jgi:polyisoprenoid-binding protein YceI
MARQICKEAEEMFKYTAISAVVVLSILALAIPGKTFYPASAAGSWMVDTGHSDAQFSADGTTDFGKTKMTFTIGVARVAGAVKLDGSEPANSAFDFTMYSAASKAPPMNEEGKVKTQWLVTHANHTLVCFHSKGVRETADGRLQTTGNLVLTRVDRNVEMTPNEAYAGPVYGPPMIHRLIRQATFVFDAPAARGGGGEFQTSGSTNVIREDFPQLLKAVTATYWPPVVQDENCRFPAGAGEAYSGSQCTGTLVESPAPPEAPHAENAEDYPGPSNFNSIVGEHLTIAVHMRLTPTGSGAQAKAGN